MAAQQGKSSMAVCCPPPSRGSKQTARPFSSLMSAQKCSLGLGAEDPQQGLCWCLLLFRSFSGEH